MFPVARGAYGQPPSPPQEASNSVAPPSSAAKALAYPVLRVLCRCTPRAPVRSSNPRTWLGVATPIVSARTTSGPPQLGDSGCADEPGRLDTRHSGCRQTVDELGPRRRLERFRFVLQTVSRPNVADGHAHGLRPDALAAEEFVPPRLRAAPLL